MNKLLIFIMGALLWLPAYPASLGAQPEPGNPQQELLQLQREIRELKKQLEEGRAKEAKTEKEVEGLEEELALRNRLLHKLNQKEWSLSRSIRNTRKEIEENAAELEKLRKSYGSRVVHLYKYGRANELEALLASESFSQAMVRLKYVRIIMEEERKSIGTIKNLIAGLEGKRERLDGDLAEQRKLIKDKNGEKTRIDSRRKEKNEVLKTIAKDNNFIEKRIADYNGSIKKIERLMRQQLAQSRRKGVSPSSPNTRVPRETYIPGVSFATLRGRLAWPVRGQVIAKFGLNYNSALKTRTDNPGIDIRASYGAEVRCVHDGRVAYVIYLPGFGNMVFVEHSGGYFSVYGNLSEISVAVGTVVTAGQTIAKVGDSGSYDGAKLNFQIWKDDSKLNPEQWLGG